MGNTLKMKMSETGKIISFEGFEPIYAKVNTAVKQRSKRC